MRTAACGGKGFKGSAVVRVERPIGAASCRQQHNQVSCQTPLPRGSVGNGLHPARPGPVQPVASTTFSALAPPSPPLRTHQKAIYVQSCLSAE